MEDRKKDHIDLAFESQLTKDELDKRFYYEPLLTPHPIQSEEPIRFLGKILKVPIWVSSMTGGTAHAETINKNLARACHEFGMGMGLGSCRIILDDDTYFHQFNVRDIIGPDYPLYANLGIAQIESAINTGKTQNILRMMERLRVDGLIIHVNPMQEWFQPEGDRLLQSPLSTIQQFLDMFDYPVVVKEVGQGMGPESIRELLKLPLQAVEFAAFGGTNFAKIELLRSEPLKKELFEPLSHIGNDADTMLEAVNAVVASNETIRCKEIIISGGIKTFLDGFYFMKKSKLPAIYGQASTFLRYARGSYDELREFVSYQVKGLEMANTYLKIRI